MAELALPAGAVDLVEARAVADLEAPGRALAAVGWALAEDKAAAPAVVAQLREVGVGLRVARVRAGKAAKRLVGQLVLVEAGVVLDLALKRAAENLARREPAAVAGVAAPEKAAEVARAAEIGARAGHEALADKVAPADQAGVREVVREVVRALVRAPARALVRVAAKVAGLALVAEETKAAVRLKSRMK